MALRGADRREEEEEDAGVSDGAWSPGLPPPPPERCLAAALLQGFAVGSVCLALADPSWLHVQAGGRGYVFGVVYVLRLGGNLTESDSRNLLGKNGLDLLILMATCCYVSILVGFTAFLLDFLETRKVRLMGVKVAALLHMTTALSTAAAVGLCSCLFVLILQEIHCQSIEVHKNPVTFSESFYFAIFACVVSVIAGVLSFRYSRTYTREAPVCRARPQTEEASPLLQESANTVTQGEYG